MDELPRIRLEIETNNPYYFNDPKLLELYNKCLPPKESYYYFPKGEEIISVNHKKPFKSIRRVFYNQNYMDYEKKALNELKELISSNSLKLPDYFEDYFIVEFVYAEAGNINKSYKRILDYLKFCEKTFPISLSPNNKIIEILNSGCIYCYGRDSRFRPILVFQAKAFQKFHHKYKTEELMLAVSFLCQFIINNMMIPGQYETWNMIINLRGVSIITLPEPLKKLIPALSRYFLCRLNKTYIFGLNFITRILFKIATNFMDPVTVTKFIAISSNKDRTIFNNIREDNIEKQFGGTAPDLPIDSINQYFPPRMPSSNFIKDEENKNDILISEKEYIEKYKNGEISDKVVSPYIYNELKKQEIKENVIQSNETIETNPSDEICKTEKTSKEISVSNVSKGFANNENLINNSKIISEKKYKHDIVKRIVNSNWHIDDELNVFKVNYNPSYLNKVNIVNDINKFGIKKQTVIKNTIN